MIYEGTGYVDISDAQFVDINRNGIGSWKLRKKRFLYCLLRSWFFLA
jgi:hypothetical protein